MVVTQPGKIKNGKPGINMKRDLSCLWVILLPLALGGCASGPTVQPKTADPVCQAIPYSGPVHKLTRRSDIKELQQLLDDQGYRLGAVDGIAGRRTKAAIRSYQGDHQLPVDAVASSELLQFLTGSCKSGAPSDSEPMISQNRLIVKSFGADSSKKSNSGNSIGFDSAKTIANRCVQSGNQSLEQMKTMLFNKIIDQLQIDIGPYLQGFCTPGDLETVSTLYTFLVTEGVIHGRIASTKYDKLLIVYDQAGVDLSVYKDALRKSTEELPSDLKSYAEEKDLKDAPELIEHSFIPDDDEEFQNDLIDGFNQISDDSPYKRRAALLLSDVLSHSTQSTFYLVRSVFVFSKLTDYFGLDMNSSSLIDIMIENFLSQMDQNVKLAWFLFNSQDDLNSMLISSTYGVRALTEDVEEIPPIDPNKATKEARELKIQAGISADELDNELFEENSYGKYHDKHPGKPNKHKHENKHGKHHV